jgi:hypothetical protein
VLVSREREREKEGLKDRKRAHQLASSSQKLFLE